MMIFDIDLIDLAAYLIFASLLTVTISMTYMARKRAKRLANNLIQAGIDHHVMQEKLDEASIKIESFHLQKTDEFMSFLTQSRDWAFNYIEDVQSAIVYLKNAMNSGNEEQINNAYQNLIELLPKEEEK